MRHLLAAWPQIQIRIAQARRVLLASDYDGTLSPIVERPEQATLGEGARSLLARLSRDPRYVVAIVSGRLVSDLKVRVGLVDLIYAGNHGLEIEGPGIRFVEPNAARLRPAVHRTLQALTEAITPIEGALVESKDLTLSVHYRMVADERVREVRRIFDEVVKDILRSGEIVVREGNKVLEVRPSTPWDKGSAVLLIMDWITRRARGQGGLPLPIFLGDDQTDEDAFRAIERYNGVAIFVGPENSATAARYFLRSPAEVLEFLSLLAEQRQTAGYPRPPGA